MYHIFQTNYINYFFESILQKIYSPLTRNNNFNKICTLPSLCAVGRAPDISNKHSVEMRITCVVCSKTF